MSLPHINEAAAGVVRLASRNGRHSTTFTGEAVWTSSALQARQRTREDMQLAREVQAGLFPRKLPQLRSLSYAGVCLPAGQLGGDYFDFLDLGSRGFGLTIGDISGKGVAVALLMASLHASIRSLCAQSLYDMRSLIRSVNRLFYENTPEASYATLFFAEYRDEDQRLRYANCGHPSPLLRRADNTIERLQPTATVLGLHEEWDCTIGEAQLDHGDTLVIYTDGVTESVNENGEEFGERRLVECLHGTNHIPASTLLQSIMRAVRRFTSQKFKDDATLVAASCACL